MTGRYSLYNGQAVNPGMGRDMKKINTTLTAAITTLAVVAVPALAQQQVGSGGRAHDANLQVGSGGVNQNKFQEEFRLRNDIVTGNVPTARALQVDVGYQAPGEFFSPIPSDDLFVFRSNSLPSSPVRLNAVQRNQPRAQSYRNISIYRQFTDIPAYRTGGVFLSPTQYRPGFGYQVLQPSSTGTGFVVGSDEGIQTQLPESSIIGISELPQGRALEVQASPLLGVRAVTADPTQQGIINLSSVRDPNNPFNPNNDLPDEEEETVEGQVTSGIGTTAEFANAPAQIPAGLILGQQLRLNVNENEDETQLERVQRLEDQIFRALDDRKLKPGEDVYFDLLNTLNQNSQDNQNLPHDRLGNLVQEEGENEENENLKNSQARIKELEQQMREALREPSSEEIEATERRKEELRKRLNLRTLNDTQTKLKIDRNKEAEYRRKLNELLTKLDYELPQIESLAGSTNTPFNNFMRRGEKELMAGQYFAAESQYRSAVRINPRNPLARVGLVHAQMGAGLIRSAANNLRTLFETNPELIAARYNPQLLPSPQRLQWVQSELDAMINTKEAGADPGLMMAYFGYQVGSKQLVRYGLNVMAMQAPNDPLRPVLQRIWIENTPDTASDDASK